MEADPDDDAQRSDAAALCVSCGLCCNGVLYSNAKAEPGELARLEGAGLTVEQVGERLQFRLPCRHNIEGRCSIYPQRFTKCRTFRCALLKRLDADEVPLSEALGSVVQAKAMVARVAAMDPDSAFVARRIALRSAGPPSEIDDRAAAELWLESLALEIFLDRTFRNKPILNT